MFTMTSHRLADFTGHPIAAHFSSKKRFGKMFLAEDLLHTVIKKVWLVSLNNDNIKEVPPIFSHHVLHAFVSEKVQAK